MLQYTVELLSQSSTPPPSLVAFCLCNLIIAMLFFSSRNINESPKLCSSIIPIVEVSKKEQAKEQEDIVTFTLEEEEEGKEEDGDDELKKRVEEYIEKMNRLWKSENGHHKSF